jgi:hypothetical protein
MKSDVEDKHYNYMCCDACLKVANFEEKYHPDTLFHCCEGKEAKGTWRKVKDIIKEKDQEIKRLNDSKSKAMTDVSNYLNERRLQNYTPYVIEIIQEAFHLSKETGGKD